ncbi:MAG: DUF1127 domain-containing protein, partial [Alphaproteobacteria bacterium]
ADSAGNYDYQVIYAKAQKMRALAVGEAIGRAFRGLSRLYRATIAAPLARRQARDAARRELLLLDEHMLKDIGITKGDIPFVVRGTELGLGTPHGAHSNENKPRRAA